MTEEQATKPADTNRLGRTDRWLLDRARSGDEGAFRNLIEPHRTALHSHCYRMLGSPHDAEDALQDTLLRAWRALPRFRGGSQLRSWLHRIATNVCLDAIAGRRRRVPLLDYETATDGGDGQPGKSMPHGPLIQQYREGTVASAEGAAPLEARYERREALELAFIAALRHIPARQRSVLILRDVLGFSAKEAADALGTTVASVNAALLRARRTAEKRLPVASRDPALRTIGDRRLRKTAERFADVFERGEIDAVLALLSDREPVATPQYPHIVLSALDAATGRGCASASRRAQGPGRGHRLAAPA